MKPGQLAQVASARLAPQGADALNLTEFSCRTIGTCTNSFIQQDVQETDAWGNARYRGVAKRDEFKDSKVRRDVTMRPGRRRALDPERDLDGLIE